MRVNKHVGNASRDTADKIEGEETHVTQKVFHIVPEMRSLSNPSSRFSSICYENPYLRGISGELFFIL